MGKEKQIELKQIFIAFCFNCGDNIDGLDNYHW